MITSRRRNYVGYEPVYHHPPLSVAVQPGCLVTKVEPPVQGTVIIFPREAKVHGTPDTCYLSIPTGYVLRMFRSRTEDPTRPWDEYRIVKL